MNFKIIVLILFAAFFLSSCVPEAEESAGITISDVGEEIPQTQDASGDDSEPLISNTTEEVPEQTDTSEETVSNVSQEETIENQTQEEAIELNYEIVEIEDLKFKPDEITIEAGTTVKWIHNDKYGGSDTIIHKIGIYKRGKTFYVTSDRLLYNDTYNYTFNEPGEYYYIDIIFKDKMRADIIVE